MSGLVWSPGPRAVACGFPAERGGQRRGCWSPGSPGTLTRRGHGSRGVNLLPGEWPSPASGPAVPGLDPQRPRHLLLELKSLKVSGGGGGGPPASCMQSPSETSPRASWGCLRARATPEVEPAQFLPRSRSREEPRLGRKGLLAGGGSSPRPRLAAEDREALRAWIQARPSWCKSGLRHLLAAWPWASEFTSL